MAIHGKRVLAVIPARGGSKRAPRKNIRLFRGQPLIAWSIHAARHSSYIDKFVVSTEDREIKDVALLLRAEVIDRPEHLANDTAANEDVLRHALALYPDYDLTVLLQPTSPLRTPSDIDRCIEIAYKEDDGCISYRQDGSKNGAVYVAWSAWLERGYNFSRPVRGFYIMDDERSLDVDYPHQFEE